MALSPSQAHDLAAQLAEARARVVNAEEKARIERERADKEHAAAVTAAREREQLASRLERETVNVFSKDTAAAAKAV